MKASIYGAGDYGQKLFALISKHITIDCFVQTTEPDAGIFIEGIPVLSLSELLNKKEEYLIFIAINNAQAVDEIRQSLRAYGYNMSLVLDMRSFIKDNASYLKYERTGDKECLLCGNRIVRFTGAGNPSANGIIGGGYRENAVCPCCAGLDRMRWVYWVLKNFTSIFQSHCTVIHFAPEKQISEKIQNNVYCDYYPGDIVRYGTIHRIDVTNIPYNDKMADFIIINHVMEHVKDEKKAINELVRVLKDEGKLIMSFPISRMQKTFEDDSFISEIDREKYYGQEDHVRLYGIDFKEHIESYGLKVQTFSPKDYLSDKDINKYGLIEDDVVLICSKESI